MTFTGNSINDVLATTALTGLLQAAQFPALTGDVRTTAGSLAATLSTVNSNVGTFQGLTVNGKGLVTAASNISASANGLATLDSGGKVPTSQIPANLLKGEIGKGFDNGSSVINTGQSPGFLVCPYAGTITGWTIIGNASGSVVVDVWKAASGSIPTVANTIVASAPPTLSSAQQATSSTLTGWTTSVAAGDVFAFSVNSVATLTHADLVVSITKS